MRKRDGELRHYGTHETFEAFGILTIASPLHPSGASPVGGRFSKMPGKFTDESAVRPLTRFAGAPLPSGALSRTD